ncbi:toxin TcdB middle/N-terminal domain-containing protein [Rhizobium alvei]|uniref:Toxin TcdB middle/N-terminal domain-containing protein n=1 Tax=Rhizobium alvei TaxID=1132659 RepID=A0ABT8YNF7_9HYPH|nr:toxin TcdB middle/N-terminal domain-containing protein [Rhizobium alvei]MDO6965232.1 toxin TcdB middle/N-terminal domain-containing protein [Rhizobium alvei]
MRTIAKNAFALGLITSTIASVLALPVQAKTSVLDVEPAGKAGLSVLGNADGGRLLDDLRQISARPKISAEFVQVAENEDIPASTQEPAGPTLKQPNIGGTGTLDYSYDIDVPEFRGLEPKISLNYSSNRKAKLSGLYQGWLGYAWGLKGFDVIERVRQNGNIPAFDADDVYALNGEEMLLCNENAATPDVPVASGTSASCSAGGTHVSENENYLRIVRNSAANTWEITNREGTKMVLKSVGDFAGSNASEGTDAYDLAFRSRWLVASITDTNGNTVLYDYACEGLPVCYPSTVTYNNTTVRFILEDRPDFLTMANGHTISTITKRIKTIKVSTSGITVGAWRLFYEAAPESGLTRLAKIRRHGIGATVVSGSDDTAGNVTGGNPKPDTEFTYADYQGFEQTPTDLNNLKGPIHDLYTLDLNGDGITEILEEDRTSDFDDTALNCEYNLFHSLNANSVLSKQSLPNLPCFGRVGRYLDDEVKFPLAKFSQGHFGSNLAETQLLFRDGDNVNPENTQSGAQIDSEVKRWAIFAKNGSAFDVTIKNCSGTNLDPKTVLQCYKDYPGTQVVDYAADGRDNLQTSLYNDDNAGMLGVVNLYGDGRQQQVFQRSAGLRLIRKQLGDEDVAHPQMASGNFCSPPDTLCQFGDVNGDGADDLVIISKEVQGVQSNGLCNEDLLPQPCPVHLKVSVYLSRASATGDNLAQIIDEYEVFTDEASSFVLENAAIRDFDGDGISEILLQKPRLKDDTQIDAKNAEWDSKNTDRPFALLRVKKNSNGYSISKTNLSTTARTFEVGDFDGDGLQDLIFRKAFRDNDVVIKTANYTQGANDNVGFNRTGYINAIEEAEGVTQYQLRAGKSSVANTLPGLLTSIRSDMGSTTTFTYTPSTQFTNSYLPFSLPTVTMVKVTDGRGTFASTKYEYSGGLYGISSKKFLGYRTVTKVLPMIGEEDANPKIKTTYSQEVQNYGMPEVTAYLNAAGAKKREVTETWELKLSKPYRTRNTATVTELFDDGIARKTRIAREFDTYGNATVERNFGLVADDGSNIAGDGSRTERLFAPNLTKYIVSLPYKETVFDNPSSDGEIIAETKNWYSGQNDDPLTTPPNNTRLTKVARPRNAYNTSVWTYTYDSFGNRITETDPVGNLKEWSYSSSFTNLPIEERVKVRNGFWLTTAYSYGTDVAKACLSPATKTQPNTSTISYTYDEYCRTTLERNDVTGASTSISYEGEGNFDALLNAGFSNAPRVITKTPLPPAANGDARTTEKTEFVDGFGRIYRSVTTGSSNSPTAIVETEYDRRGNVSQTSLPHEPNATTIYWTVNAYDWDNRLTKTTHPGGNNSRTLTYSLPSSYTLANTDNVVLSRIVTEDEVGDKTETNISTDGDVVVVRRKGATESAFNLIHGATYDRLRRLVGVKDPGGAQWSYAYDLLGNRKSANDPDMGTWTYQYDDASRLVSQTDARGKITTIDYDGAGRVLTKVADGATITKNIYDDTTTSAYNMGQLTSTANGLNVNALNYALSEFTYNANGDVTKKVASISYAAGSYIKHAENTFYHAASKLIMRKSYSAQRIENGNTYNTGSALDVGTAEDPWTYNLKGQLLTIPSYVKETTYAIDGQTAFIKYGNNVTTDFSYSDTRRWLTRLTTQKADATKLIDNVYTRDAVGRITAIAGNTPRESWTYTYDGRSRLATATNQNVASLTETFTYTDNNNMTKRSRGLNPNSPVPDPLNLTYGTTTRPHAVVEIEGREIVYDDNGNTTDDKERTYTWDGANRLKTVVKDGVTTTFAYGGDGARVKQYNSNGKITLYPDANVEVAYDPGANSWTFTRYPHLDVKIEGTRPVYLHRDHLASVRMTTTTGAATEDNVIFAAFGEPTKGSAGNAGTPVSASDLLTQKSYIGERYDVDTGLMYLNARYMNPVTGRYIPPDTDNPRH